MRPYLGIPELETMGPNLRAPHVTTVRPALDIAHCIFSSALIYLGTSQFVSNCFRRTQR